jgi:hypothetical protein
MTSMEDVLIGRCPQWKITAKENNLNEDNLSGR